MVIYTNRYKVMYMMDEDSGNKGDNNQVSV